MWLISQKISLSDKNEKSETDNTVTDENSQNNSVVEESVNDTANAENNAAQETVEEEQKETGPLLVYSGHVQSYGNVKAVEDGALLGTTGQAKRLEALKLKKVQALKN